MMRSYFTPGLIETAPPPDSGAGQYVCIRSRYVHCTSSHLHQQQCSPVMAPLGPFFADPRPTIRTIVSALTGAADQPPESCVDSVVRLSANLERVVAGNPLYADAPVVPLDLEINVIEAVEDADQALIEAALEQSLSATTPADKSAVEALEEVGLNIGEDEDRDCCSVCWEGFGERLVRTPCKHVYHKECIVEWLRRSNLCPMCRYAFPNATWNSLFELRRIF